MFKEVKKGKKMRIDGLCIKCVIPNLNAQRKLYCDMGQKTPENFHPFISIKEGDIRETGKPILFDEWQAELVSYKDAMDKIKACSPSFPIRMRDEVLFRNHYDATWEIGNFARYGDAQFHIYGKTIAIMIIPYKCNELYHGTSKMPPGHWAIKNGEPFWKLNKKG